MPRWIAINGVLISVLMSLMAPAAFAATPAPTSPTTANGSPGQGLEISPPVIELQADPGQTITTEIRVRNVTRGELIATGRADDFGASNDESGQPKLLLDETEATRYSLKFWINKVPDLSLAPMELKATKITIAVPRNAEPGSHFGVVRFTAVPPNVQGTGVALSASVGTLILLKVSGNVTNKLEVAEFTSWQNKQSKSFFEYGPVTFLVRLKNVGTVHEKAKGSITVVNTFGNQVGAVNVNDSGGNVLPDSIRRFEQTLSKKQLFGRYSAKLALTYADGKKLTSQLVFWVIPWKLIVLALIGLLVLVYILRLAVRRYNEHIIAKAQRR